MSSRMIHRMYEALSKMQIFRKAYTQLVSTQRKQPQGDYHVIIRLSWFQLDWLLSEKPFASVHDALLSYWTVNKVFAVSSSYRIQASVSIMWNEYSHFCALKADVLQESKFLFWRNWHCNQNGRKMNRDFLLDTWKWSCWYLKF